MHKLFKKLLTYFWKPLVLKYLTRPRLFHYQELKLIIRPGVFHPGIFFSTQFLLNYIKKLPLEGKSFLELGAGSGLISFVAKNKGADVTATDISYIAIAALKENQIRNNLFFTTLQSDLFDNLLPQQFDVIAINPPYYKSKPSNESDYAWYCGENLEYFSKLFSQLKNYVSDSSTIVMVLSEDCAIQEIAEIARQQNIILQEVKRKKIWFEENFILRLITTNSESPNQA